MAKYIEATKCAEVISERFGIRLFDLVDVFAEIPSADVVPRAELEAQVFEERKEVDILKSIITRKEDEAYKKGYNDALTDVEERLTKKKSEPEDGEVNSTEEKYFSAAEVRNMTPAEVRANYAAIRKSMEQWC